MPFLIDGYNLYHTACKTSDELSFLTPPHLCHWIAEDMLRQNDQATVVFDGTRPGADAAACASVPRVKVLYSGAKSDADTVLETLIGENTAPRRLIVVSSDRKIRAAARRRKSVSLSSRDYLAEMLKRQDIPAPPPKEPPEKHKGVSKTQRDQWLDLFGITPQDDEDDPLDRIRY